MELDGTVILSNGDREGPHGLPPPTPPYIRVTYKVVSADWVLAPVILTSKLDAIYYLFC